MRVMYTSLWAQYYILLKLNDYIALFKPKNKKIFFTVPSISVRFPAVIINRVDCSDGKILTLAVSDQWPQILPEKTRPLKSYKLVSESERKWVKYLPWALLWTTQIATGKVGSPFASNICFLGYLMLLSSLPFEVFTGLQKESEVENETTLTAWLWWRNGGGEFDAEGGRCVI